MNSSKLNVAKALVLIALCCPVAFGEEGDQGSGGLVSNQTPVIIACTASQSGGGTAGTCETPGLIESILTTIYGFLGSGTP